MARDYERSHPWLRFDLDLRKAPPTLWMLLGEARSKCEHILGVPLRPATVQQLHQVYLAKGVQATTAIEGNTLTEEEVLKRVRGELKLPPSKEYLGREIDNITHACNEILSGALANTDSPALTREVIAKYHARVLDGLEVGPEVTPGAVRSHSVGVGSYRGAPAQDCEHLLERLCTWLQSEAFEAPQYGLAVPILKAAVAHLYLAWIHPFGDGNGRTARLIEFHLLVNAGVPSPAAHLLSSHYNQTRSEYYRQLDQASRSGGDVVPFLTYAVQGFVDQLKEQLAVIRDQQWDGAWRNYVHETFKKASGAALRQRHVVLALSTQHGSDGVTIQELRRITPRIAEAYAGKTQKTLSRDVNALEELGLVRVESGKVHANRELILGFLPAAARAAAGTALSARASARGQITLPLDGADD